MCVFTRKSCEEAALGIGLSFFKDLRYARENIIVIQRIQWLLTIQHFSTDNSWREKSLHVYAINGSRLQM